MSGFVNNRVVASGDPDGFAAAAWRCHAFPVDLLSRQKASAPKAPMPLRAVRLSGRPQRG